MNKLLIGTIVAGLLAGGAMARAEGEEAAATHDAKPAAKKMAKGKAKAAKAAKAKKGEKDGCNADHADHKEGEAAHHE